jgi:integrase
MEKLEYHAFRKPKVLKNGKTVHRWYYYWLDDTGKQIQKSCGTKVKKREDAESFIRTLPPPPKSAVAVPASGKGGIYAKPARMTHNNDILVRDLAENMFIPGSPHLQRRKQLKKSVNKETVYDGRIYMNHITAVWGDRMLRSLEMEEVMNYLFSVERSGSWKNRYISFLNEIYQESQFMGCKIFKPDFPSIGRDSQKADILSDAELERFFKPENFAHDFFLFFLCSLSGGLRLGETRALKVKQIIFEKSAVIIDGFLKDDNTRTNYNKCGSPEHPKLRVVIYPDFTLNLLKKHIERNAAQDEDYVFTYNEKPISKSMAERAFIVALINAGLTWDKKTLIEKGYWKKGKMLIKRDLTPTGKKLIPRSLRFTYVTRMSPNIDARNLKKMTGHDSEAMVNYYNRKNLEMALAEIPDAGIATSALLPQAITQTV